ncbi:MAG: P1 family peptidase [candidate division KSB1 bacterium]|nr:P1 family peptidase [candidate division KSB1 bacterium]MDZ7275840.1 P1 family peptidase [candidate division KSB1 bacterium]MDZ7287590.1 P1 family peptidase [candidate division KSB1 bacterium]MDZ7306506.1 P1 family peptidase [candidate division KSB1 bacterium]MDZ7350568.1 P1 family peptidase [candidate division KSB1 bacterium]
MIVLLMALGGWATVAEAGTGRPRAREAGVEVGILPPGPWNAITDVRGVKVGHCTVWRGDSVRTGVTVILPHAGNIFQEKVPAAVHCGNAFGKLAGSTQVVELGTLETPIALTNTLSVPVAVQALVKYTLQQPGNEMVTSVNAVVGETNDGWLNDIRGMHVQEEHVWQALQAATSGAVEEGSVGAGTGTHCLGFKGGIGTSSRRLPPGLGCYTVGVLVQTNFGGILTINGAPVGRELGKFYLSEQVQKAQEGGSCMMVVATDAPLSPRNLERLARRALFGLARAGSFMANGSGDYVIAFSTAYRIAQQLPPDRLQPANELANEAMTPLFLAVVEATEEAVYNSLFKATTVAGRGGHKLEALPIAETLALLQRYQVLHLQQRLPGLAQGGEK